MQELLRSSKKSSTFVPDSSWTPDGKWRTYRFHKAYSLTNKVGKLDVTKRNMSQLPCMGRWDVVTSRLLCWSFHLLMHFLCFF